MGQQQVQAKKRKSLPAGFWIAISIVIILIVVLAAASVWILTHQGITQGTATLTIISIVGGLVVALFAALFTYLQWRYPVSPATAEPVSTPPTSQTPSPSPPIIIQLQQQASPTIPQPTPIPDKPISASIIGTFPPTDPKTIQQRQKVVEQVYSELTKPDVNCIVLTGIGGVGKSTAAALVYRYAEEQRKGNTGPFTAESLWFTAEATTNLTDVAQWLSTALDKPIANFGQLPLPQQAVALFHLLNTTDSPRLMVVNQFENLLNAQTGQTTDPGLGEWIDMLNSLGGVYDALGKKQEALAYYQQALDIRREVGNRSGEGTTLWNIGTLYFERSRYDVALAFFLLARGILEEVLSPDRDDVQEWIDDLRAEVGEEQFAILLAQVEPQAQQIVEQALKDGL